MSDSPRAPPTRAAAAHASPGRRKRTRSSSKPRRTRQDQIENYDKGDTQHEQNLNSKLNSLESELLSILGDRHETSREVSPPPPPTKKPSSSRDGRSSSRERRPGFRRLQSDVVFHSNHGDLPPSPRRHQSLDNDSSHNLNNLSEPNEEASINDRNVDYDQMQREPSQNRMYRQGRRRHSGSSGSSRRDSIGSGGDRQRRSSSSRNLSSGGHDSRSSSRCSSASNASDSRTSRNFAESDYRASNSRSPLPPNVFHADEDLPRATSFRSPRQGRPEIDNHIFTSPGRRRAMRKGADNGRRMAVSDRHLSSCGHRSEGGGYRRQNSGNNNSQSSWNISSSDHHVRRQSCRALNSCRLSSSEHQGERKPQSSRNLGSRQQRGDGVRHSSHNLSSTKHRNDALPGLRHMGSNSRDLTSASDSAMEETFLPFDEQVEGNDIGGLRYLKEMASSNSLSRSSQHSQSSSQEKFDDEKYAEYYDQHHQKKAGGSTQRDPRNGRRHSNGDSADRRLPRSRKDKTYRNIDGRDIDVRRRSSSLERKVVHGEQSCETGIRRQSSIEGRLRHYHERGACAENTRGNMDSFNGRAPSPHSIGYKNLQSKQPIQVGNHFILRDHELSSYAGEMRQSHGGRSLFEAKTSAQPPSQDRRCLRRSEGSEPFNTFESTTRIGQPNESPSWGKRSMHIDHKSKRILVNETNPCVDFVELLEGIPYEHDNVEHSKHSYDHWTAKDEIPYECDVPNVDHAVHGFIPMEKNKDPTFGEGFEKLYMEATDDDGFIGQIDSWNKEVELHTENGSDNLEVGICLDASAPAEPDTVSFAVQWNSFKDSTEILPLCSTDASKTQEKVFRKDTTSSNPHCRELDDEKEENPIYFEGLACTSNSETDTPDPQNPNSSMELDYNATHTVGPLCEQNASTVCAKIAKNPSKSELRGPESAKHDSRLGLLIPNDVNHSVKANEDTHRKGAVKVLNVELDCMPMTTTKERRITTGNRFVEKTIDTKSIATLHVQNMERKGEGSFLVAPNVTANVFEGVSVKGRASLWTKLNKGSGSPHDTIGNQSVSCRENARDATPKCPPASTDIVQRRALIFEKGLHLQSSNTEGHFSTDHNISDAMKEDIGAPGKHQTVNLVQKRAMVLENGPTRVVETVQETKAKDSAQLQRDNKKANNNSSSSKSAQEIKRGADCPGLLAIKESFGKLPINAFGVYGRRDEYVPGSEKVDMNRPSPPDETLRPLMKLVHDGSPVQAPESIYANTSVVTFVNNNGVEKTKLTPMQLLMQRKGSEQTTGNTNILGSSAKPENPDNPDASCTASFSVEKKVPSSPEQTMDLHHKDSKKANVDTDLLEELANVESASKESANKEGHAVWVKTTHAKVPDKDVTEICCEQVQDLPGKNTGGKSESDAAMKEHQAKMSTAKCKSSKRTVLNSTMRKSELQKSYSCSSLDTRDIADEVASIMKPKSTKQEKNKKEKPIFRKSLSFSNFDANKVSEEEIPVQTGGYKMTKSKKTRPRLHNSSSCYNLDTSDSFHEEQYPESKPKQKKKRRGRSVEKSWIQKKSATKSEAESKRPTSKSKQKKTQTSVDMQTKRGRSLTLSRKKLRNVSSSSKGKNKNHLNETVDKQTKRGRSLSLSRKKLRLRNVSSSSKGKNKNHLNETVDKQTKRGRSLSLSQKTLRRDRSSSKGKKKNYLNDSQTSLEFNDTARPTSSNPRSRSKLISKKAKKGVLKAQILGLDCSDICLVSDDKSRPPPKSRNSRTPKQTAKKKQGKPLKTDSKTREKKSKATKKVTAATKKMMADHRKEVALLAVRVKEARRIQNELNMVDQGKQDIILAMRANMEACKKELLYKKRRDMGFEKFDSTESMEAKRETAQLFVEELWLENDALKAEMAKIQNEMPTLQKEKASLMETNAKVETMTQTLTAFVTKKTQQNKKLETSYQQLHGIYQGLIALEYEAPMKAVFRHGIYKIAQRVSQSTVADFAVFYLVKAAIEECEQGLNVEPLDIMAYNGGSGVKTCA